MPGCGEGRVNLEILLIDDEPHMREAAAQALELADLPGTTVRSFEGAAEALAEIGDDFAGILISDIKMPGMDGLVLLGKVREIDSELPIILVTGHGDIPLAIQAIRAGAYEFIEKPYPTELLVEAARRALDRRRLVLDNRALRRRLTADRSEQAILGQSAAVESLRRQVVAFAATDADVLILGETGSGKELVARTLHRLSARREARFLAINCGALPETMIESELFGHEAGAFTGAQKRRIGKFEHASGGTLFLDEIESMPRDLQVRLLRVLQERSIERLGSNETIDIDVRVVAATKVDLRAAAADGSFREDLFYRLNVLEIDVPPLRERVEDVPVLFRAFLAQVAERNRAPAPDVDADTLALLLQHPWPGNVRELQNVALRFAHGLGICLLPPGAAALGPTATLADRMAMIECQLVRHELDRQLGNLKPTYEALGISRKTLYDKMRRYGLGRPPPDDD
ncbi:MAG: sigma-54-dependent Fis family transcriptional regulator [Hyphomicrobiaceae bacterium]|nr:MAG: sigma-54-dependent Fis family transcriptional regulator [Hyphomicrobiaceae bacterium]